MDGGPRIRAGNDAILNAHSQMDSTGGGRQAWLAYLADLPSGLELPADFARRQQNGSTSRRIPVNLDPALAARLISFSRKNCISDELLLRAAWCFLFHRLYQLNDYIIGLTTGSNKSETGQFTELLPARIRFKGSQSIVDNLAQFAEMQRALSALPAMAFEEILATVKPPRFPGRHPLFNCLFHIHLEHEPAATPLSEEELLLGPGRADFDFAIIIRSDPSGGIVGIFEYKTALYDTATVSSWVRRWQLLLERMLAHPEEILDEMDILHPGEESEIIAMGQGARKQVDPALRLHDFLSRQTAHRPNAAAILCGDRILTYAEADRRTSSLASALVAQGVGPGTIVGAMVRRSEWLPIALFGVLKADGAYLPVDPDFPAQRIHYLLQDSRVEHLIIGPGVTVPDGFKGTVYCLPEMAPDQVTSSLPDRSSGSDPAYVIYTSGSTGLPKGTRVLHRSIVNQLLWMQDYFNFDSEDVFLQSTACTFDVSLFELFVWAIGGGQVAMPEPLAERDPRSLIKLVNEYRITHLHFVPSMMSAFFAYLRSTAAGQELSGLKAVVCSGEALSVELVKEFRSGLGNPYEIGLYNLYGPTEAAVHASYFDCAKFEGQRLVPIGRPVWNTDLYIFDKRGKPLPKGAIGELHIGGVQVADGYLNRAELTRERFIPDPYGPFPESRLYKTGDLARFLNDGNIEYLGRNDFQIQIRGVRVEPSEIEKALTDIPAVAEAVVIALPDPAGDMQLTAYVTGERDRPLPESSSLFEVLRQRLPSHFVPAAITVIPHFPLNASGKLDRIRLPAPVFYENHSRGQDADRREDPLHDLAASIWSDVMKTGTPRLETNFFDHGGHSLLAIRLLARLQEATGREIALPAFFDNPTFRGLCESLRSDRATAVPCISAVAPGSREALPLTWGQQIGRAHV